MDYKKVYNSIIDRAKERALEGYKERHHIIPKCMGGADDLSNLVDLTAREHLLCHWLLSRIHPESRKLAYAFFAMTKQKSGVQERYTPSSRAYEEAKSNYSKLGFSDEHCFNISKTLKERGIKPPGNEGVPHSDKTKSIFSKQRRGVKWVDRMNPEAYERTVKSRSDNNPSYKPEVRAKSYVSKFGKNLTTEEQEILFLEKIEFYKQRDKLRELCQYK